MIGWLTGAIEIVLDWLLVFLGPILDLVSGLWYLLGQIGQVAGLVISILWRLLLVLLSVGGGLVATVQSMAAPAAADYDIAAFSAGWTAMADQIPGLDVIGWVLCGILWIVMAATVIRTLGRGVT